MTQIQKVLQPSVLVFLLNVSWIGKSDKSKNIYVSVTREVLFAQTERCSHENVRRSVGLISQSRFHYQTHRKSHSNMHVSLCNHRASETIPLAKGVTHNHSCKSCYCQGLAILRLFRYCRFRGPSSFPALTFRHSFSST